jgi:membrane associated rhomboid family serine protease
MENQEGLIFSRKMLRIPVLFVFTIWLVYWIEIKFGYNFNKFGVLPREWRGLKGILFSPFIHGDTKHLFNNSVPLFVLSLSLFYFYKNVANRVMILGTLLTGLLTWIIARESYHIGASGVVYLLFSFVFFSGVFKNHFRLIAVSLVTIFLYGSMVWFLFPTEGRISWEGHLSGFVVGIAMAFLYRKRGIVKEEYQFSRTSFDLMFDENGNLIETPEEVETTSSDVDE